MTAADKASLDGFGNAYLELLNQSGSFQIDATEAIRFKITLNGNGTPTILLPSESKLLMMDINPGTFTWDWSSLGFLAGHIPPVLIPSQSNMVVIATDGTNLYTINGTGVL